MNALVCTGTISRQEIADFSLFSGDSNPIHLDPIVAQKLGFKDIVAQGMLVIIRALQKAVESSRIDLHFPMSIDARFRNPVYPGLIWNAEVDFDEHMLVKVTACHPTKLPLVDIFVTLSKHSTELKELAGRDNCYNTDEGWRSVSPPLEELRFSCGVQDESVDTTIARHLAAISTQAGTVLPGYGSLIGRISLSLLKSQLRCEIPTLDIVENEVRHLGKHVQVFFKSAYGSGHYHSVGGNY